MKHMCTILINLVLLTLNTQAQTRIQSATGNTGTSALTTFNITLGATPTNGNTLIAVISSQSTATNTISSISQTGATWTRAISSTGNATNGTTTEIWYTTALSGGATALTINQISAVRSAAVILEYEGLLYGAPLDVAASNFNATTSTTASTGTTATFNYPDVLLIGGIGLKSSSYTLSSITNSFTAVNNASSTNSTTTRNAKVFALEKIVNSTGTATAGGTVSTKSYWSGAIAVFISAHLGSFTPTSVCKGDASAITLNGSGFTAGSSISFNGVSATTTYVNSNQLTAGVPALSTSGFITVSTGETTLESKKPFLIKSPPVPTANITNTTCPTSTDGAIAPNNIPIAVNFDYTKSQYINLGTQLLNNLNAFTLEGWVKCLNYNRNSFLGQNNAIEIGLTSAGTVELWSEGLSTNLFSPSEFPTDGMWHHIAGTGDGTTMKIYIDGELIASKIHETLPATILYGSSAYNTMIGGYVWDATTANYHNGQIMKAGFWNRALTNTEIAALASIPHGYTVGESNLIAGYNFYEGTGTTLSKTPAGTNGTFTGTTVSTWSDLFTYSWTKAGGGFSASTKTISTLPTGTYNLAATFNGCTSNSGNFVVASNGTESTAATSISGDSPICNGSSSTLTLTGGTLGTGASWKWYSGSCGSTLVGTGSSISVSPTTTTTYYVRAEGSCNTTACVSFTVNVNATGTWLGTTSTDWNTASNWCGIVPTSGTDVIIPAGTPNQPIIGDADGVCNSLTINAGATVTISGTNTITLHGNWINNGTFTANSSNVIFNGTSTISGSSTTTFNDLTINSTKSLTASAGNVNITGDWTNNGTFTNNGGTISFTGTSVQDITGETTFQNLTINNTAGVIGKSNLTVNSVLNLTSVNASATVGTLDMNPVYSTDVLTGSNTLYMGATATTTGIGDVTGRIVRTTINANIDYSFGNANTTIRFYGSGTLPTQIKFVPRIGVKHSIKNNTVKRTYQIVRTGGTTPTLFSLKLAYLQSELDTLTESRLVYWDHHIPYNGTSPHEHGKTELNTSNNWITLSGHGIRYLAANEYFGELAYVDETSTPQQQAKIWMISGKETTADYVWIGAATTSWDNVSNWTSNAVPTSVNNVIISNGAARDPQIPANETRQVKSITIESNRTLTAGNGSTIEVYGSLADNNGTASWNNSGNFVPNTSSVVFKCNNASISGSTQFYNLSSTTDSTLLILNGSSVSVSGSFTNNGKLNGSYNGSTTFTYNGGDQTIQADANSKYHHLTLSGTGTKTIESDQLIVKGDLLLNATIAAQSSTLILDGMASQTISGSTPATFNNLTINNANGVTIGSNETINGTLTLTNGLANTDANTLTVSCNGTITGQSNSSYINGKLAREYCSASSKIFPIGKGGIYRPLTLEYTTLSGGSSTVLAEQFESEITGSIPTNASYQTNRYWNLTETDGVGNGNYILTLNGSPFTPAATAKILRGNGTTNSLIDASYSSPDFTSTSVDDNTFGNFAVASECVPPTIDTHPSATSSCELNGTPQFSVDATGTNTYQWEVSQTGSNGTFSAISNTGVYSNATTSTLTITNPPYSMNGYAYRVVVTRDCGGGATSNDALLTVNPLPQGSLTANAICKGETGYLTWTATSGTGPFVVVYNAGAGDQTVNNVASGAPFPVGTLTTNKTYTLVSVANATCSRTSGFTQGSATVTVNPYITWTGAVSTDWNTASNWCGGIPTTTDNALIPATPVNQPIISETGSGYVHSIIVEKNASVTVGGNYVFNVSGNITNAGTISMGTGTLTIDQNTIVENVGLIETQNTSAQPLPVSSNYGNSGTIRFNSTQAPQTLFAGTYNDVVVDNPQGVVLAANANVTAKGTLEIKNGSRIEIGAGQVINAASVVNNAGEAGIVIKSEFDAPSGTFIFNNAGETPVIATVEMVSKASWTEVDNVRSNFKWQFVGIPVQSLTNVLPTFYGGFVRRYNEGGIGAGFEPTKRWIQLQDGDAMEYLSGYEVVQNSARKYDFPGLLYNQDINLTLSYTAGADYPGQHLIGNPYTAAIDITAIQFGANMEEAVYIYNTGTYASWTQYKANSDLEGTSTAAGQYIAIPKQTAGTGQIPGQIPAMQAFMVRTNTAAEGSIFVDYNAVKQRNNSMQRIKKTPLSWMRFNLTGATADQDVMWVFSKEGTTRDYDNGWDGKKLAGDAGTARIQAVEGASNFQIDVVPNIHETVISARAGKNDTQYKLKIANENMLSEYNSIYLLDLKTNDLVDISQSGTEYLFTMTNTASEPRFKILTSAGMTTGNTVTNSDLNASIVGKKLIINNQTSNKGTVRVYETKGIELLHQSYPTNQKFVIDLPLQEGIYLYKLENCDGTIVSSKMVIK